MSTATLLHPGEDRLLPLAMSDLHEKARYFAQLEVDFIPNIEFREEWAEERILRDEDANSRVGETGETPELPKDLPAHLARLCEAELLTASEERDLFRRMNYLKYRANALRVQINPDHPNPATVRSVEEYLRRAREIRDRIVQANMRLVIAVVKKFVTPQTSFDDLLSDGTMTMMNAVDKFDYDRGFRFSTYAYRSIARNAYRVVTERQKEVARFGGSGDDEGFDAESEAWRPTLDEQTWNKLRDLLALMLDRLDRRERFIIRGRYALGNHAEIYTFQALADKLGVSKERVRQLEQRAVAKLRNMAAELQIDDLVEPVFSA
jgi:RNA polymerase primary sigma factor